MMSRGDGMVDIGDLKSPGRNAVRVQFPPSVPKASLRALFYVRKILLDCGIYGKTISSECGGDHYQ